MIMADKRTQQQKLHEKHGGLGTDASRDASKQGPPGQPKMWAWPFRVIGGWFS